MKNRTFYCLNLPELKDLLESNKKGEERIMESRPISTEVPFLGQPQHISPLKSRPAMAAGGFVSDSQRVVVDVDLDNLKEASQAKEAIASFEVAGPREKIFFDPPATRCALVTCGGLCPGLNDIIRSIVYELFYSYGVNQVYGIKYGLQGLVPDFGHQPILLTPEAVSDILDLGGSMLGSSRGPQEMDEIIATLEQMKINILFMIGGDGTLKAATRLAEAIREKGLAISVIGVPKTIDNDIYLVSRSFGFDTAVDVASQAIKGAHSEAAGYPNGIGLIKLMGRHSGYIAATASLARQEVNFVLIPEIDFDLKGEQGLLANLERRLLARKHAVIVVAEGAGQKFFQEGGDECDESGNVRLQDIGLFLKERITTHFKEKEMEISLKYIDPSYMIRSLPANPSDRVFCGFLGRDAAHAAMAGKTRILVGHWNNHFLHIPMDASVGRRKQVDPTGKLWRTVLGTTGQGLLKNG